MSETRDFFEGFESRKVQTFGAEIFMRIGGSGPPLLLLHGYPQTHVMWHTIAPKLKESFTVIIPDLRGYGQSSCPNNDADNFTYSKRAMGQDMVQVMDALGFEKFALIGHDRGGRVAYRMALDYAERVRRIAVLDIVPTHAMWHDFTVKLAMKVYHWLFLAQPAPLPEMLIERAPVEFLDYTIASWTRGRSLAGFDEDALAHYRAAFSRPDYIHASCNDYRAGQSYDLHADEADFAARRKLLCPLLALWGDAGIPGETDEPLAVWKKWGRDVRGQGIDAGHFIVEENPEATLAALIPFIHERG